MDSGDQYFFKAHSQAELRRWAKRLKLFRYCRAYGGHANDGDSLEVTFSYGSAQDIKNFLDFLGFELVQHATKPPQPETGVPYPGNVFALFPRLIKDTEWIEQPGHCRVGGIPVFIWCEKGKIRLSVSGGSYEVTDENVAKAEALEKVLVTAPLRVLDPPRNNKNCFCPKYYPDYFDG
ncbi:MAG: hypothetical protein P1P89_01195 [Desulfobacterales bacterium]|nr:hypothetical protein [Desulfobacterales bacterium]